jgi:polyhydroxyalkanoate synthesis regulator phasin
MAAKAQEISMEAGSKMAAAMKDVINAAAGTAAFSIESARDLVQFMVRRSQMTQDEADKLIAAAEEATRSRHARKPAAAKKATAPAKKTPAKKTPAKKKPVAKK